MSAADPVSNPYAPPNAFATRPATADNAITPAMLESLRRTQPWAMFLAVIAFIGAGFCALASIALAVVPTNASSPIPTSMLALVYVFFTILSAYVGFRLAGYSSALGNAAVRGDSAAVENALDRNRGMWLTYGVMTICMILATILSFAVGIAIAASRGIH